MELAQLLMGLARIGFRGSIGERSLSSLVAWAKQHSVAEVLQWIEVDPGLIFCPSWQFLLSWQVARHPEVCRHGGYTLVLFRGG